jgi:hypothetical protein
MTAFRRPRRAGRRGGFVLPAVFVLLIVTVAGIATMLATSMDLTSPATRQISNLLCRGFRIQRRQLRSDVIHRPDACRRVE